MGKAAPAKQKLRLHLKREGQSLGSFTSNEEKRLSLGSSKKADLVLPGKKISGIHAMLCVDKSGDWLLYDLGSKCGTKVDGKSIIEEKVKEESTLQLGEWHLTVEFLKNFSCPETAPEQCLFWKKNEGNYLDLAVVRNHTLCELYQLAPRGSIVTGYNEGQIYLDGLKKQGAFAMRKKGHAYCYLPKGFHGEIYNNENELLEKIEEEENYFCLNQDEKARIVSSAGVEIQLYWRTKEKACNRHMPDTEAKPYRSSLLASSILSLFIALGVFFLWEEEKTIERKSLPPASSYYRITSVPQKVVPEKSPGLQKEKGFQKSTVALKRTLSNILKRKTSTTNRAPKVFQASIVPHSSDLKTSYSGGKAKNIDTKNLIQSLGKRQKANLKGFGGKMTLVYGAGNSGDLTEKTQWSAYEKIQTSGGLEKSVIAQVVNENLKQIKHCYERQLMAHPHLSGKIVAHWIIDSNGRIHKSTIKKTTMNNSFVENCILGKIKLWKFPKPQGGGKVIVNYPFLFKTAQ